MFTASSRARRRAQALEYPLLSMLYCVWYCETPFLFSFALFITIFGEVFGRAGVYMARDITGYVCGCVWFYCGVGFRVRMPVSRILYLRFFAYLCNWTEHRQSESEPQRGGSGDVFHRARVPLPAPPVGAFIRAAAYYIFASAAPGRVTTFDSWRKRRP